MLHLPVPLSLLSLFFPFWSCLHHHHRDVDDEGDDYDCIKWKIYICTLISIRIIVKIKESIIIKLVFYSEPLTCFSGLCDCQPWSEEASKVVQVRRFFHEETHHHVEGNDSVYWRLLRNRRRDLK